MKSSILVCLLPVFGLCAVISREASMKPVSDEAGMRSMDGADENMNFESVEAEVQQALPGPTTHITASVNHLWRVYPNGIFRCSRPCTGQWVQVPGMLKQVDASDQELWGVTEYGNIFKRPVDGSGGWQHVPGRLKHVSASGNGYIWGVNANDHVFKCKKPCNGEWEEVMGERLKQVDGGQSYVYGVNIFDQVFVRPVDGSGSWRRIPGLHWRYITASADSSIYGIGAENKVYSCKKPCLDGSYELLNGIRLTQVDGTFDVLAGVLFHTAFLRPIPVP